MESLPSASSSINALSDPSDVKFSAPDPGDQGPTALEFARAMAGNQTRVRILDQAGKYSTSASFSDIEESTVFAVLLADKESFFRCMAFDLDAKSGTPEDDARAQHDADVVSHRLDTAGIRFVVTRSGPTEARHVLATFQEPGVEANVIKEIARRLKSITPSLDICMLCNAKEGCIRPPLSLHKSRQARSEPIEPSDHNDALRILRDGNDPESAYLLLDQLPPLPKKAKASRKTPVRYEGPIEIPSLPDRAPTKYMQELLAGTVLPHDSSRSGRLHAFVRTGLKQGFSPDELFVIAMNSPLHDLLMEKSEGPRAYFDRSVWSSWLPTGEAKALVGQIRLEADRVIWSGEKGAQERMMLEVMLRAFEEDDVMTTTMSAREAGDRCGVGVSGALNILRRLVKRSWLLLISPGDYDHSATYSLSSSSLALKESSLAEPVEVALPVLPSSPSVVSSIPSPPPPPCCNDVREAEIEVNRVPLDHDAFRWGGLGALGWWLHRVLVLEGPMTQAEVAARIDRSSATASTVLNKLELAGLASRTKGQWRSAPVTVLALDTAALRLSPVSSRSCVRSASLRHARITVNSSRTSPSISCLRWRISGRSPRR